MLRNLLLASFGSGSSSAAVLVAGLPPYQVAFWPDGWDLEADGSVLVRDTHTMAEARRWYRLADRNRPRGHGRRLMSLHGIFVPRAIVDLADRRFPSERVASVAVQLIAGEWVEERRRRMLATPRRILAERSLSWSGSRYEPGMDGESVRMLVEDLIDSCADERLIPDVEYRVRVHAEGGYGILCHRCSVYASLDRYAANEVLEALRAALVPWNRGLVRSGCATRLIELDLGCMHRSTNR